MTDFYYKEKGVQYPAKKYFNENLKDFEHILIIIEKYLKNKFDLSSRPTELNFVKYPYLGDELFTDNRILTKELDKPKEYYNQLAGVAFYIKDEKDQNQILREGYRHIRLSYIAIVEHYSIIENSLSVIHELNHFNDPFSSSINYAIEIYDKKYTQDTKLFIEFNVRHLLNEYYANFRSYIYLKSILSCLNLKEYNLKIILNQSVYNLLVSLDELGNQLVQLTSLEENYRRFNLYLSSCFQFFETIFKLLGKWDGLKQDFIDIDKNFTPIWEKLIKELNKRSLHFIVDYLSLIKSILNPDFERTGEIKELYNLFLQLAARYQYS